MNGSEANVYGYYWTRNFSDFRQEAEPDVLRTLWLNGKWEIPLYSVIFLLSVLGNILVILTLGKNNRMRTITNVFLLNLAASDLVLTVLCMPFTLIGTLLRDFIFGNWMCKLVPFLQATSVAASVWTLVALSIERYYAICHPLRSRKWQTLSHARRLIGSIWIGGSLSMLPILILTELQPTKNGHNKCRENWPSGECERAYNLFLDVLLLVVPLLALAATYYLIATTLWKDVKKNQSGTYVFRERKPSNISHEKEHVTDVENSSLARSIPEETYEYVNLGSSRPVLSLKCFRRKQRVRSEDQESRLRPEKLQELPSITKQIGLRHTNLERSLVYKQRVIKMLLVVVLEFFICWTPLYVINTLALFWPQMVYGTVGYKTISFCQLLAYSSGCCNPITYCFMNKGFRNSFISMFTCRKQFMFRASERPNSAASEGLSLQPVGSRKYARG